MAEPLKNSFGPDVPKHISKVLAIASDAMGVSFDSMGFLKSCLDGYESLELTPRASHIADAMAIYLPENRTLAMKILLESLGSAQGDPDDSMMASFKYLPHVNFVADHGQGDFETAMTLQYELTKLFTAEFSIRSYLEGEHQAATLERLREWTTDSSEHVRRLVSEGSRPRLPWAKRLPEFIADPTPVVELLELLRHDESEYVRRSVANNLNDIAKDHPQLVVDISSRWWADATLDEKRMIRHALRTPIKNGDPGALEVLGFGKSSPATIVGSSIEPEIVDIGGKFRVEVEVNNPSSKATGALVDLKVHFVKANGATSPKVFKGAELMLAPGETKKVRKTISVKQHSTRKHYPGEHRVEALINGVAVELAVFQLR